MTAFYVFLKRYWKPLLLLLIVILSILAVKWYGANQYASGVSSATATMQDKFNKLNIEQTRRMAQASKNYQELKTKREAEQGVQYVEVERIVEKPVYLSDCIDDDGLSQINRAAGN